MWRKPVPGRRVTLLAESTLASVYMAKKVDPLALANSVYACSDCLALTKLTPLREAKCLL